MGSGDKSGAQRTTLGTSLGRRTEVLGAEDKTGAQGTSLGARNEMFVVKKYHNRSYFKIECFHKFDQLKEGCYKLNTESEQSKPSFDEFSQFEEACYNLETEADHEPSNPINIHPQDDFHGTSQLDSIRFSNENTATVLLLEQEMDRYSATNVKGDDNTATFGTGDEYLATFDTRDGYFAGSESGDRLSTMLGGPVGEGDNSTLLAGSVGGGVRCNRLAGPVASDGRSN